MEKCPNLSWGMQCGANIKIVEITLVAEFGTYQCTQNDNTTQDDNAHEVDNFHKIYLTDGTLEDFLKKIEDEYTFKNKILNNKSEIKRYLTNQEELKLLNSLKALEFPVMKQMPKAAAEGNLELIFNGENFEKLNFYIVRYRLYTGYLTSIYNHNKDKKEKTIIIIQDLEDVKKLKHLLTQIKSLLRPKLYSLISKMQSFFYIFKNLSEINSKILKTPLINIVTLEDKNTMKFVSDSYKIDPMSLIDEILSINTFSKSLLYRNINEALIDIKSSYEILATSKEFTNNEIKILQNLSINDYALLYSLEEPMSSFIKMLTGILSIPNYKTITLDERLAELKLVN